jgi:hypothetical protein
MKIAPTIEGGLRIDPENDIDWHLLRSIMLDANASNHDLAARLGDLISHEKISEDWQDIVVPDLRESFSDDLHHVYAEIETAAAFPHDGENPIWITPTDAHKWYSSLNQARLELEEIYHFGEDPESDPKNIKPIRRDALLRSRFYCGLQSLILDHAFSL